jgi:8-oxo-dGTP diphosphatase
MSESEKGIEQPLKSRGAGIIFYIAPTDQLMFFLRDDKPSISCPGMIDIIGGHMEDGETPKAAALREVAEEIVDNSTGKPFTPDNVTHFKTFVDSRPGEHNIFLSTLNFVPDFHITEGQGLVFLSRDEARNTDFAYGYSTVVGEFLDTFNDMPNYGFDPASATDRQEWMHTTPPHGTPAIHDYSNDAFAFGSAPKPTEPERTEV